jgi:hypothetical protein
VGVPRGTVLSMQANLRGPARWFSVVRKRRAVRRYLVALPRQLVEDYGHGGPYTTSQVAASVRRAKRSREFVAYAQAIFCDVEELLLRHPDRDHYDLLRRELALRYFGGGPGFTYLDVTRNVRLHSADNYPRVGGEPPVDSLTG